ncbi:MAG: T9SS type A sorting domain-containing protein [Candidatus Krumholzibacteriia bacterium]
MRCLVYLVIVLILAAPAGAQVRLPLAPTWTSQETSLYGTGLDLGDVDGDQWLDLAVSNGNDIVAAPNLVYLNAEGTLPPAASWVSSDHRYSGHCQLADLDGDGRPELMVANYISAGWGFGQVQVYANVDGTLSPTPTWESPASFHSFRASFGDPDQDGDLDLAVATGEAYHGYAEANLIFFNVDGVLQSTPGWVSDVLDTCYDVEFVDIDGDGDQDLAFLGGGYAGVVSVYFNEDGVLATTPGWTTASPDNGNTFDFDDLDLDGRPDLLVGNNDQLGGSGRFAVYLTAGGVLPTVPTWTSAFSGYASAVVCADLDRDSQPDLVAGGWWEPVRVYLNRGGGAFAAEPDWQSDPGWASVVENLALADLDARQVADVTVTAPGGRRYVELDHRHLQSVDAVLVDGVALATDAYCYSLRDGWVSLGEAGLAGSEVRVEYRASPWLDLAVSNWDDATYVFESPDPTAAPSLPPLAVSDLRAVPNPFNPLTSLRFTLTTEAAAADLRVYDVRGRLVAQLLDGPLAAGAHTVTWQPRDLASGVYLYRLVADGVATSGKVVLAR